MQVMGTTLLKEKRRVAWSRPVVLGEHKNEQTPDRRHGRLGLHNFHRPINQGAETWRAFSTAL
jgi:hypothetical protein